MTGIKYIPRRDVIRLRNPTEDHSRPQSPSFRGHVVSYKLSRVALGTRMGKRIDVMSCMQNELSIVLKRRTEFQ